MKTDELTLWQYTISSAAQSYEKIDTLLVLQKGLTKYINDPKCLRMSQHHLQSWAKYLEQNREIQ